jgi:uracil phosphoribosyltransferase
MDRFVAELRDVNVQGDRMRFRRNLERIGEIIGYELSKQLNWENDVVNTPLGEASTMRLADQPVLATILRAGLPSASGITQLF